MKTLHDLPDDQFATHLRRAVALDDAPPALLRAALDLWATRTSKQPGLLRRLMATLSFDSSVALGLPLAVRGARSGARHLLFSAEGRDVDLRISAVDGLFVFSGQVLGPDETGRIDVVNLAQVDIVVGTAQLNELGEFRLDALSAGRYQLTLTVGNDQIGLPVIDLGAPVA